MTLLIRRRDGTVCMSMHDYDCFPTYKEARSQYENGYTHICNGKTLRKSAYKSEAAWLTETGRK